MSENRAYQKAIYLLTQPVSLAAILILLVNDHILRQFWPSWLSGKLGDFAWLFFFPVALAAVVSWAVPVRMQGQVQVTGMLAFGLTGTIFTLAKTLPFFHEAVVKAASQAFGFPVGWLRDPSDLIALSALAASWLWWRRTPEPQNQARNSGRTPAWLLLTAAVLLTVANAAQPEAGIGCLRTAENQISACSAYACYSSTDGGLTWSTSNESGQVLGCPTWYYGQDPSEFIILDPGNASIQYRSNPGERIERSSDGGQIWQVEYELRPTKQAERAYAFKSSGGNAIIASPPLDGMADATSGNIIFAMGFSGVLVRQADGTYRSVAVGNFSDAKPAFGEMLAAVLSGEGILGLIFGGLGIATISLPQKKHWLRITALVLGWLAWGVTSIIFAPAIQEGAYAYLFPSAGMLGAGVLALVLAVEALIRKGKQALRLILVMIGSAVLYFLPFVLWLVNLLPVYYLALGFGVLLGGGLLVSSWRRGRLPG
jgi:hypothetical protein